MKRVLYITMLAVILPVCSLYAQKNSSQAVMKATVQVVERTDFEASEGVQTVRWDQKESALSEKELGKLNIRERDEGSILVEMPQAILLKDNRGQEVGLSVEREVTDRGGNRFYSFSVQGKEERMQEGSYTGDYKVSVVYQ
jgi:hypothetical protein